MNEVRSTTGSVAEVREGGPIRQTQATIKNAVVQPVAKAVRSVLKTHPEPEPQVPQVAAVDSRIQELCELYARGHLANQQQVDLEAIAREFGQLIVQRNLAGHELYISGQMPLSDDRGVSVSTNVCVRVVVRNSEDVEITLLDNYLHHWFTVE